MTANASVGQLTLMLRPLRRRLQGQLALRRGWAVALAGLEVTLLLLLAGRLWPWQTRLQSLAWGLGLTVVSLAASQLAVWLKPVSMERLARTGDAVLGLEERLITALELAQGQTDTSTGLKQAQFDDTVRHFQPARLPAALPLVSARSAGWGWGALLAAVAAVVALSMAPNPQEQVLQRQAQLAELFESEIAQLETVQANLLAQAGPVLPESVEALSDTLADLLKNLEAAQANLSPEEGVAALTDAQQQVQSLQEQSRAERQAMDALAESLGQANQEALRQASAALQAGDPAQAAEALQQAVAGASGPEAQSLAESLSQAADALSESNAELAESLQQAADALQSGDTQAARQAMEQAAGQLAQSAADAQALAQMQQALDNIQQAQEALARQSGGAPGADRQLGQGSGQGAGSGRGDPGANADAGTLSVEGPDSVISTDNGPNQNRQEDYSGIYAPQHLGGEGGEFVTPQDQNPDGGGIDMGETAPNPNRPPGESIVPYDQVFQQYAGQAGTALQSDYIPLDMKEYIRQYFGALEPDK